jgi:geranylgeranyl transferase type-1 subunit beta
MGESKLNIERHIQYWQRCLKTLLPTQYTSTDSSRMSLGFFILSALDLLGAGADTIPEKQRADIREWILKCQHPNGGFCGSPNHKYPDRFYVNVGHGRQQMDPANLPATYFAILSLRFVGNLEKVKRRECLRWLRMLQREDGSFGELITKEGKIEGGRDMRYCYVAMAVRWILRGDMDCQQVEDINVEKLVDHLRAGQVGNKDSHKVLADEGRLTMVGSQNHQSTRHMVCPPTSDNISLLTI